MNERKLKQLNILALLTVIAAVISIGMFVFVFSPDNDNRINTDNLKLYNEGWG